MSRRMSHRSVTIVVLTAVLAVGGCRAVGQSGSTPSVANASTIAPAPTEQTAPAASPRVGYAPVDGLDVYYEIHGIGEPIVLLHGAYTTIDIAFGALLPALAADRQVIAIELQGHGHTADTDRPLSYERLADDTAAVLRHLGVKQADLFGYSMGANVALQTAIRHPDLVRRLAVASAYIDPGGLYPGVAEGIEAITPESFTGSGLPETYAQVAPDPEGWARLVEKVKALDRSFTGWSADEVSAITAPTLVIAGDSDIVRSGHAVELFELLGGGTPGDVAGLPDARLAILPGTTHIGVLALRSDWISAILGEFLDEAGSTAQ